MHPELAIVLPLFFFFLMDLIILINSIRHGLATTGQLHFTEFVLCICISQGLTTLTYACDLGLIAINHTLQYTCNLISLLCMANAAHAWFVYLYCTSPIYSKDRYRPWRLLILLPVAILAVIGILSSWTGWLMYIDDNGVYQSGPLGNLQLVPYLYYLLALLLPVLPAARDTSFASILRKFPLFAIPSVVGAALNMLVIRGGYTQIGCSFGVILMYLEQYIVELNENQRLRSVEALNTRLQQVNEEQRRSLEIVGSLSQAYFCIYYIDLAKGTYVEVLPSELPDIQTRVPPEGEAAEAFQIMCRYLVAAEDVQQALDFTDLSTLAQRLEKTDVLYLQSRGAGKLGWCMGEFIASRRDEDGVCTHVLWAVRSIQEQKEKDEENQRRLMSQLNLINTLSRDYLNVYVITPATARLRVLKLNGYITQGITDNTGEYPFDTISRQYIESRVYEPDIPAMTRVLELDNILQHLENASQYTGTYRVLDKGEIHYYQYKFVRIVDTDSIIAGFQNVDDMIAEQRASQLQLETALAQAEQANAAKTLFLNNMSHDIRTPMNAILGFARLMENKLDEPDVIREYLGKLQESGQYLLSIINNVLDMARIESGKMELDLSLCDVDAGYQTIIDLFSEDIVRKHQTLTHDIALEHRYVLADGPRIQQIMVNILSNAVKYTPDGGSITMEVREQPGSREGFAVYRTVIADNGVGMSTEFQEHIFESFAREHSTTESRIIGTGLGMSIVKKLVDRMGGTIAVESEPGKGSRFTVTLELALADTAPAADAQPQDSPTERLAGRRILLAEDNDLNAEIAMELLSEAELQADRARDGVECIDMLRKSAVGYYDLILMDIQMPNLDGYQTTRKIRSAGVTIPIIAMTANAFEEDRRKALEAGMNAHLSKPIDVKVMLETIAGVLRQ